MKHKPQGQLLFSDKELLQLTVPLLLDQLLSILVGMADSVMVAGVGEAAVSAVSLVDSISVLIINLFSAMAAGGAVVAGQYLGRRDEKNALRSAGQLYWCSAVFSLAIMAVVYLLQDVILHRVFGRIDADVMSYCRTYLLIVAASYPFIALYNAGAALYRTMGNSKTPMYISLLMNAVNVAGNAVLIYGLNMGVAGAAIPTLFSRMLAAVLVTALLTRPKQVLHLDNLLHIRPEKAMVRRILHVGIPGGVENSMFQLGKIVVLSMVSGFGTMSIAANAVANTLSNFLILVGAAVNNAIVPVVARCIGYGSVPQARYYTRKLMSYIYVGQTLCNAGIYFALPLILGIYQLKPDTAALTTQLLLLHMGCGVVLWPLSFSLPHTLRAAGDVTFTMAVAVISMWVCRVVLSYVLALNFGLGVLGVWVAMILDWCVRIAFYVPRYLGHRWETKKVI